VPDSNSNSHLWLPFFQLFQHWFSWSGAPNSPGNLEWYSPHFQQLSLMTDAITSSHVIQLVPQKRHIFSVHDSGLNRTSNFHPTWMMWQSPLVSADADHVLLSQCCLHCLVVNGSRFRLDYPIQHFEGVTFNIGLTFGWRLKHLSQCRIKFLLFVLLRASDSNKGKKNIQIVANIQAWIKQAMSTWQTQYARDADSLLLSQCGFISMSLDIQHCQCLFCMPAAQNLCQISELSKTHIPPQL
jgi:hypothetical protein